MPWWGDFITSTSESSFSVHTTEPNAVLLHPSVPAKTVPEFISYAKINPGKIAMASGGNGAPSHISGEMFKMMTGVSMVHVPYRGAAPALTDLLAGQVQIYFAPLLPSVDHIKTGRLRVLAVTSLKRSEILPDIPTVAEFVIGRAIDPLRSKVFEATRMQLRISYGL